MADYRCYLTKAGIAAENNAKNFGLTLKITEMVFDGGYLDDDRNPEELTDVINAKLSVPCASSLSDDGQTLTFKGSILVDQGGFNVWGIGLKTDTGVLYGYARSKGDKILTDDEGATESVRYAVDIITKNADVIEIKINQSTVYADLEDVDNAIGAHETKENPHPQYMNKYENGADIADPYEFVRNLPGEITIYIDSNLGDDNNDGLTTKTRVKTLARAFGQSNKFSIINFRITATSILDVDSVLNIFNKKIVFIGDGFDLGLKPILNQINKDSATTGFNLFSSKFEFSNFTINTAQSEIVGDKGLIKGRDGTQGSLIFYRCDINLNTDYLAALDNGMFHSFALLDCSVYPSNSNSKLIYTPSPTTINYRRVTFFGAMTQATSITGYQLNSSGSPRNLLVNFDLS